MAQVNIRIDDDLKAQADILFDELGMNMTTAVNIFVSQAVREGGIPFNVTTKADPFYGEANMKVLRQSMKEAGEGKFVSKTIDELLDMEK